jgi:AP2 domain
VPRSPRNITRTPHGWLVAIKRKGRWVATRFFANKPTSRAALARAVKWRDEVLSTLPPPRRFAFRRSRSSTGIIGVSRVGTRAPSGHLLFRYVASWYEKGRQVNRGFSVLKYGEAKARDLAVKARQDALAKLLRPRKLPGPKER